MNKIGSALTIAAALVVAGSHANAYDPLSTDEKQTNLAARIKVAQTSGEIHGDDVKKLNTAMRELGEKKKKLKALHTDILTAEDDAALDKDMNVINSKLEEAMARKKDGK